MVCCFGAKLDLLKTITTVNWCVLVITPLSKIGENIITHNYRLNRYIMAGYIPALLALPVNVKLEIVIHNNIHISIHKSTIYYYILDPFFCFLCSQFPSFILYSANLTD